MQDFTCHRRQVNDAVECYKTHCTETILSTVLTLLSHLAKTMFLLGSGKVSWIKGFDVNPSSCHFLLWESRGGTRGC